MINEGEAGGQFARSAASFREMWIIDFEFNGEPGDPPRPVCMVAREVISGRELRLWRDELLRLACAPFDISNDVLVVAYFASAELSCFSALAWPLPRNVLDLFVEHRVATNGVHMPCGDGLLGAMAWRGLTHVAPSEKAAMRQLILERNSWSHAEQQDILRYCAGDVAATEALLRDMASGIDLPRALLRGRYMAAVARMEATGIPVDVEMLTRLRENWDRLRNDLVADVDRGYGVYIGNSFSAARFEGLLARQGIEWPRLQSGALALDKDTFKIKALEHPQLEPLRQLRKSLGELRLNDLQVGADGRNRCLISPFRTRTGRNAPSNSKFIFGPAKWLRSLIQPPRGHGLAYIDWSSQEIAIAAALSGDAGLLGAYASGDPYLAFAKAAGLAPQDATKTSHKLIRDRCKAVVLGVNYGMGPQGLAARLSMAPVEARELLRLHREAYPRFWRWSEAMVDAAILTGKMTTVFGFELRVSGDTNVRQLMNWPMQAHGAEMMRVAAIGATEAGIEVGAPVHDAFLICAPLNRLDEQVAAMREIMEAAGRAVLGGVTVRTDAEVVRWPDRYHDPVGTAMWETVIRLLNAKMGASA